MGSRYYDRDARFTPKGENDCGIEAVPSREVITYGDNIFTEDDSVGDVDKIETFKGKDDATLGSRDTKVNKSDLNGISMKVVKDVKRQSLATEMSRPANRKQTEPLQEHLVFTCSNELNTISSERKAQIAESSRRKRKFQEYVNQPDVESTRTDIPRRVVLKSTNSTKYIKHGNSLNHCNQSKKLEVCLEDKKKIADIIGLKLKKYRNENYDSKQEYFDSMFWESEQHAKQ